jgi:hypothetical protein
MDGEIKDGMVRAYGVNRQDWSFCLEAFISLVAAIYVCVG